MLMSYRPMTLPLRSLPQIISPHFGRLEKLPLVSDVSRFETLKDLTRELSDWMRLSLDTILVWNRMLLSDMVLLTLLDRPSLPCSLAIYCSIQVQYLVPTRLSPSTRKSINLYYITLHACKVHRASFSPLKSLQ